MPQDLDIYELSNGKPVTSLAPFTLPTDEYRAAFEKDEVFLKYYTVRGDGFEVRTLTRREFWALTMKAASYLGHIGLEKGNRFIMGFTANNLYDLVFRLGASLTGCVPVTINWEADDNERVAYKTKLTNARLFLYDEGFASKLAELKSACPGVVFFEARQIEHLASLHSQVLPEVSFDDEKLIVFTSGTTGRPKGVSLLHRSYLANRLTFESFLGVAGGDKIDLLLVNPMHHTNSTALTDWGLRRPGTVIHLIQRYGGAYWKILGEIAREKRDRLITSLVARHIDFLENLAAESKLPLPESEIKSALKETEILIGSAPVGPTTVSRILRFAAHMPYVRFGSTETCLQVMGTPLSLSQDGTLKAFQAGWSHEYDGGETSGYYIGRPHFPFTRVKVVKSTDPESKDYFRECANGEPGYLVTQGANIMSGYVGNDAATKAAFREGWYIGLRDIGFTLKNESDGESDFYWMSRDSELLVRGGAKYAYEQIAEELSRVITRDFGLKPDDFKLAVVGLRLESEHEDTCCVTIELGETAKGARPLLEKGFIEVACKKVSKGARPHHLRFAPIPVSFKGAILYSDLQKEFQELLKPDD
ncbi:MAG: class I adenylate-forming enzyme family protein [Chloroflexota bacterium]